MTTDSKFVKLLLIPAIFLMVFCMTAVAAEKKPVSKPATKPATAPAAPAPVTGAPILDPKDPKSSIYLDSKGNVAGTGDIKKSGLASADARVGAGWHPAALAQSNLPVDKYGLVDWAKVIKEKMIDPRYSLDPAAKPDDEAILDMNIFFETKSNFMDNVVFPHYMHSWWLSCEACHQSVGGPIFEQSAGANDVKMVEMADGKWCGRCHGRVAFPLADCKRCHAWPKANKPSDTFTLRGKH